MATRKKAKKAKPAKRTAKKPARKAAARRPKAAAKTSAPRAPKTPPVSQGLALLGVSPSMTVNDLATSMAFWTDVVGFKVQERFEREGRLLGVGLQAGEVFLMLGQDDWQKGRDRQKGQGFRMYLMTNQDVDAIARKIEAAGGVLDQPPTDQEWGARDLAFTDPDGFKVTIARWIKPR